MIQILTLEQERRFTEYHRRRGEIRDAMRFGVYPNLVNTLRLFAGFQEDYAPGGALHDPELWQYYLSNIQPIAAQMADLLAAGTTIVQIMEAVELAAPGTFGIEASAAAVAPVGEEGVGDGGEEPQP